MDIHTDILYSQTRYWVNSYFWLAANWLRILVISAKIMLLTCIVEAIRPLPTGGRHLKEGLFDPPVFGVRGDVGVGDGPSR